MFDGGYRALSGKTLDLFLGKLFGDHRFHLVLPYLFGLWLWGKF